MLKHLILSGLMITVVLGCDSSDNKKKKDSSSVDTASATGRDPALSPDSLQTDTSLSRDTVISRNTMTLRPPRPEPALPPGTARISGRVLSVTDSTMTVKVLSVTGYGSSTPAIGTGAATTVYIPSYLSKEFKKVKSGKKIVCLINYRQFLASDTSNNNSRWVLKDISSFGDPQ